MVILSFPGSFGKVYRYEDKETGIQMAIKEITIATEQFSKQVDMVRKEVNSTSTQNCATKISSATSVALKVSHQYASLLN